MLLKEILEAHSQRGNAALQPPIVILGLEDKEAMDEVELCFFTCVYVCTCDCPKCLRRRFAGPNCLHENVLVGIHVLHG